MKAIVFDKSGTIVDTCRVSLNLISGELESWISSTGIVDKMHMGALLILEKSQRDDFFSNHDEKDFASYCKENDLTLKCVYSNTNNSFSIEYAIQKCESVPMSSFKRTIDALIDEIGHVRTNNGIIYDIGNKNPIYVISTGGNLFPGVRELFKNLEGENWDIYIATGDTLEGIIEISSQLDLPLDRIFCFQDDEKKAKAIRGLKEKYDTVVMVGNDSNDILAFKEADTSILVLQDGHEKSKELLDYANYVVDLITDIKYFL